MTILNKLRSLKKTKGNKLASNSGRFKVEKAEPSYVVTAEYDGRKYVDLNKFFQDSEIQQQIRSRVNGSNGKHTNK